MKLKIKILLHILLIVTIVGLAVDIIANPTWNLPYGKTVAIIALTLLIIEILIYSFGSIDGKVSSFCKKKVLRWSEIIADKLNQYSKRLLALQSKPESLDLLSPQIVEKSEYVSILKAAGHKVWITKLLNPFVWLGSFVLQPINKMFATYYYAPEMSKMEFDYQLVSFEESLKRVANSLKA